MVAQSAHQQDFPDAVRAGGADGLAAAYEKYLAWEQASWNGGRSSGVSEVRVDSADVGLGGIGQLRAPFAESSPANDNRHSFDVQGIVPALDKATEKTWNDYGHSVGQGAMQLAGLDTSHAGGHGEASSRLTPFDPNASGTRPTANDAAASGEPAGTATSSTDAATAPVDRGSANAAPVSAASVVSTAPVESVAVAPASPPELAVELAVEAPARKATRKSEAPSPFAELLRDEKLPGFDAKYSDLYGQGVSIFGAVAPINVAHVSREAQRFYGIA